MDGITDRFTILFRALRVLRRIVLWGVLAFLALFLVALGINAFDERPSPQALALLQPPANPYGPDENIYVALAGFDAPSGQSVVAAGQAKIADYNERVDSMLRDPLVGLEPVTATDTAGLKFEGSIDCCHPREPSFWGNVRANAAQIEQLVTHNRELYQRYLALFDLPGYYETARPSYMAPLYRVPTAVQSLFLASTSLQMQSGDDARTQAALKSLHRDITLWHRILTGEGTLISKMLAVSYLQTDFSILAAMIADPRVVIPQNMDELLPQFELSDWNVSNSFAAEFRSFTFLLRQTKALADNHWQPPDTSRAQRVWNRIWSPIEGQFFKLNATENLDARLTSELAEFTALDPSTFSMEQARYRKWAQLNTRLLSIRTLYNPTGKILLALAVPSHRNYLLRPYDAAALQRLVRLSFEIRRQRIAPSAIGEFMRLHPEWSTHPADGRSFVWNASTGEIAIQPVAEQTAYRVFSVQIRKASMPIAPAD